MFRVAIITLSDKGYAGEREDKSGEVIREIAEQNGYEAVSYALLPDDRVMLADELRRLCDNDLADLILTTGGTGFSPRDITPEATLDVAQKLVPGIPEAMRYSSLRITKRAMLSRSAAAIREKTLIVNLPGSPKAVRENLEYIITELHHGLEILRGKTGECARQ
ncbi:MogA/MoaB family molybdenum cofactor biosynthesis protein [Hydrogenoanaerobacterium sp.]|uniref:MogA/MoaB family molybdenum cofactor biosynthesis protein n=1 Tax=Hydrogenoanaerobacterium sp. TaxID=2953763 RepID=UPI0028A2479C|nr:MogA/MoaB family molybdenum cofactor biosynthesis protein [Hydrogenoanaerobacterium sp.]